MIKLVWRFALLVALAAGFAWLADRPGTLTVRWLGREIEMSFVAGVALAFIVVIAQRGTALSRHAFHPGPGLRAAPDPAGKHGQRVGRGR